MKLRRTELRVVHDLKPTLIPDGFVLIQDTREQRGLFDTYPGLTIINKALKDGDYSIKGFEDAIAIERKQMSDFYGYIGKERDKTKLKLDRFRDIVSRGGFCALVVEADEKDILAGNPMSRVSPEVARGFLVSLNTRYGIHGYYSRDREAIKRWMLDRMVKFYNIKREVR